MKYKHMAILVGFLSLAACNQDATDTTTVDSNSNLSSTTEVTGTSASILGDYDQSSFSRYVYWHKTENKILIDYNFFPSGTDFDSQLLKATLPCNTVDVDDSVNPSVNVPETGTSSCTQVEIDLSSALFTLDGLVFDHSGSLTTFAQQFGFSITSSGFLNSTTGAVINVAFDTASLQNVTDVL